MGELETALYEPIAFLSDSSMAIGGCPIESSHWLWSPKNMQAYTK